MEGEWEKGDSSYFYTYIQQSNNSVEMFCASNTNNQLQQQKKSERRRRRRRRRKKKKKKQKKKKKKKKRKRRIWKKRQQHPEQGLISLPIRPPPSKCDNLLPLPALWGPQKHVIFVRRRHLMHMKA